MNHVLLLTVMCIEFLFVPNCLMCLWLMTSLFSQKRSVEDLKERYYNICGKLTKARAPTGTEPKVYIFDAGHERRRKDQLERLFNRTPEQVMGDGERE